MVTNHEDGLIFGIANGMKRPPCLLIRTLKCLCCLSGLTENFQKVICSRWFTRCRSRCLDVLVIFGNVVLKVHWSNFFSKIADKAGVMEPSREMWFFILTMQNAGKGEVSRFFLHSSRIRRDL
jgi:hypothetical protein